MKFEEIPAILVQLKEDQADHDAKNHDDIYNSNFERRLGHVAHHNAKYTGRFVDGHWSSDNNKDLLTKTYSDAMLMNLSAANALKIPLHNYDSSRFYRALETIPEPEPRTVAQDEWDYLRDWSLRRFASVSGKTGKAMDSLQHVEPGIDARKIFEEGTKELFDTVIVGFEELGTSNKEFIRHVEDTRHEIKIKKKF